jgi:hypothetical protein
MKKKCENSLLDVKNFRFLSSTNANHLKNLFMSDNGMMEKEEIFSKVLRAGRRTYFFDVRATRANDYYLTITESKKFTNDDGSFFYKKHKIYLYKEDFTGFNEILQEMTDFILNEKGEEVISERHQKDFKKEYETSENGATKEAAPEKFTNVSFDDI